MTIGPHASNPLARFRRALLAAAQRVIASPGAEPARPVGVDETPNASARDDAKAVQPRGFTNNRNRKVEP